MTLVIFDPQSGQRVTITVPDRPREQQPAPATVVKHPKSTS